jgi:hypothetical protein
MKKLTIFAVGVAAVLAAAEPVRADVRVTMHDGLVSVVARDATVRQILDEWAKIGQTRIVNAERIAGGPMTIEFSDVPEKQALDILLRSVNGYLAAPRPTPSPNASRFDRIMVLPTSTQPRSASSSSPAPAPLPQSRFQLPTIQPEIDDALTPNFPGDPSQRQPAVNVFTPPIPGAPPPPVQNGRPTPAPASAAPTGPVGTSAPGVIVPPTPPQGQPQQPQGQPPLQPQGQPGRF